MTPPSGTQQELLASQVEAPQAPAPTMTLAADGLVPAQLLDGGEIIILALKPSLWFVPIVSLRWLALAVLLFACAQWSGLAGYSWTLIQVALIIAFGRLGYAMLQWASRSYYLTNRRVMRIRGV